MITRAALMITVSSRDSAVAKWKNVLISNQKVLGLTPEEHSDFCFAEYACVTPNNTSLHS